MPKRRGHEHIRRSLDPEAARRRRMNLYRQEYWDILAAARQGLSYTKTFTTHNETNAFLSQYYRFRMDAIETRTEGALFLREVYASGIDGDGETFSTRYKHATPPFTIRWNFTGSAPGAQHMESQEAEAGHQTRIPAFPPISPPIEKPKPDLAEGLVADWLKKPGSLISPGEGVPPEITDQSSHICTEWNEYDVCVEPTCGKPK